MSRFHGVSSRVPAMWLGAALALGCVEQAEEKPTSEDMDAIKKNLLSTPPTPQFAVNANLDDKVVYLGLDASPNPAEVGKDLKITQYFQVKAAPGEGWRLFMHVQGSTYLNADHGPIRGKYPVAQWKKGEIVRDEHIFRVPANWTKPTLEVFAGLWRSGGQSSGQRMTVKSGPNDGQNRVLAATIPLKGGPPPAIKRYLVHKTPKPIKLDGKLDDPAWATATPTDVFANTTTGAAAEVKTTAKLLWDDKNLYIAFENTDTDVATSFAKRDDELGTQDAVEVMLDANGDGKTYVDLQVAPNNTVFDAFLPERRKYEDSFDPKRKKYDWSSKVKTAVRVDGTLNKREDQDKGWTVEIALPLADANGLLKEGVKVPPALGDTWRINLFRLDSNKGKEQLAAAWSAPLTSELHTLDRFGQIVFTDEKGFVPVSNGQAVDPHSMMPAGAAANRRAAIRGLMEGIHQPTGAANPGSLTLEGAKSPAAIKMKKAAAEEAKKK